MATFVERRTRGFGRTRLVVVDRASAAELQPALTECVAPKATVVTDAFQSWKTALGAAGMNHEVVNVKRSGRPAHESLPAVSRVASQFKRWLMGTMQGAVSPEHLQSYGHQFEFRFNRRRSQHRGQLFYRLLEQAVQTPTRATAIWSSSVAPSPSRRLHRPVREALPRPLRSLMLSGLGAGRARVACGARLTTWQPLPGGA